MSFFLGAYATAPGGAAWDQPAEAAYYRALSRLPRLRGLEIPFAGALHPHDEGWLLSALEPAWDAVLTLIPATMARLGGNPRFGLASEDEAGRAEALAVAHEACAAVARLNQAAGRERVVAVELHSAPRLGVAAGSGEQLARSLIEIGGWDWQGAKLTVEHCDAWRPGQPPLKGFLALDDEIAALRQANGRLASAVGMTINWGRSVLEARDAGRPLAQIVRLREAGLLSGLMFSGCSGAATPWGAWNDSHMPLAPSPGIEFGAEGSLLTVEAVRDCLRAAGGTPLFVGAKLAVWPAERPLGDRIGVNRDILRVLAGAIC